MALDTLTDATEADQLKAALDTVYAAWPPTAHTAGASG